MLTLASSAAVTTPTFLRITCNLHPIKIIHRNLNQRPPRVCIQTSTQFIPLSPLLDEKEEKVAHVLMTYTIFSFFNAEKVYGRDPC